jgi:hypothetical protein
VSKVIIPTVGRKVWYRPSKNDLIGLGAMQVASGQPLDATIIAVWGDRMVNVLVTDIAGKQIPVLSCTLLQPGDVPATDLAGEPVGRYVEWMPFQQGQAKVAESVEAAFAAVQAAIPRLYTLGDVKHEEHWYVDNDGTIEYRFLMRDNSVYRGSVTQCDPAESWSMKAIADVNRQLTDGTKS